MSILKNQPNPALIESHRNQGMRPTRTVCGLSLHINFILPFHMEPAHLFVTHDIRNSIAHQSHGHVRPVWNDRCSCWLAHQPCTSPVLSSCTHLTSGCAVSSAFPVTAWAHWSFASCVHIGITVSHGITWYQPWNHDRLWHGRPRGPLAPGIERHTLGSNKLRNCKNPILKPPATPNKFSIYRHFTDYTVTYFSLHRENQKVCCKAGTLPAKPMPNACWRRISRIFSWNGNQQGPRAMAQSANFAFKIFMFKSSYFGRSWITCWDAVINTRLVSIMGHPVPGAQCKLSNEMAPPSALGSHSHAKVQDDATGVFDTLGLKDANWDDMKKGWETFRTYKRVRALHYIVHNIRVCMTIKINNLDNIIMIYRHTVYSNSILCYITLYYIIS